MGYGLGLGLVVGVGVLVGEVEVVSGCVLEGGTVNNVGMSLTRLDFSGVGVFYSWGAGLFLIAG